MHGFRVTFHMGVSENLGPEYTPKQQGSYDEDACNKDPQVMETPISGCLNAVYFPRMQATARLHFTFGAIGG